MEFTIKQEVLKEELGYIQGVVERKSTIPVLSNILIESLGENSIRIVGTDLDVTIRCDAEADIKTPGSMCIQARKLFDLVRTFDGGDVHFAKEDNEWVRMKAGRASIRLAGVNREQYPEIPIFKSAPLKLPAEVFSLFIRNTAFAITNEQSRFTLSGAKFVVADGVARMVTTDGHRLAFIEKLVEGNEETKVDTLIPKKALLELVKLCGAGGDVQFGEDQNHIYFEVDGRLLITRKLSGNFPNYEMVMPKDNDRTVVFDLQEMKKAVRRISLLADDRNRSIRVIVRDGEVEVTAQSSEEGEGNEIVPADHAGEETTLGFNWQYLLDFLNNIAVVENIAESIDDADESSAAGSESSGGNAAAARAKESSTPTRVSFEFKDSNSATQLRIAGESTYDYKYVVMPLRI
jgi:DNA polymerase III subunit beta